MPYTISDVDKHKKGLTADQKKQWVKVANSVLKRCMDSGGVENRCAASAIRQANGVVGNSNEIGINQIFQVNDNYEIQRETLFGKNYLVVPVVMMKEGVHNGSVGAVYHSEELLSNMPDGWNGIPIMVDHPRDYDGNFVSANSPEVIEQRVGTVFHANYDNGLRALAYLDEEKLKQISPDAYEHIIEKLPLDVSLGMFTEDTPQQGQWHDEQYESIARNYRPDHLALLPGSAGACSWSDGCGIRINKNEGGNENEMALENNEAVTGMEKKRKQLGMSVSEFYAIPRDPPSASKLPIFDEAHVRNALARFNQITDVTAEEKTKARSKIRAKAKKFGIKLTNFGEGEIMLVQKGDEEFEVTLSVNQVGYREITQNAQRLLDSMDNDMKKFYLQELFDDYVVFEVRKDGGQSKLYKQNYNLNADNTIELTGDPMEVRKQVSYVTLQSNDNNKGDINMPNEKGEKGTPCCEETVNVLIANKQTRFEESDKDWLMTLSEIELSKLFPAAKGEEKKEPVANASNQISEEQALQVLKGSIKTVDDAIGIFPAELQDQMRSGLALHQAMRKKMIDKIKANSENGTWTDDELNSMSINMLKKISSFIKEPEIVDYSMQNAGGNFEVLSEEDILPATGVELKWSDK